MEYPGDFPAESRAKVEAARIRAGRRFEFDRAKAKWNSDIEALFKSYVLAMFLAFAKEASRLRLWPVDKMRKNCQEFLRLLTIEAYFQKGKAAGLRDMISNWNGSILWEFQQEIEQTPQWRQFENILLKLAERSPSKEQVESSRARNTLRAAPDYVNKLIGCLALEPAELVGKCGNAAPFVRQLAEIVWNEDVQFNTAGNAAESHRNRAELIQIISREHPAVAKELGLLLVDAPEPSASTTDSLVQNNDKTAQGVESKPAGRRTEQEKSSVGGNWFDSEPNTVRRRQLVLRNPRMLSSSLCKVFDGAAPPIPLPRDWRAELSVSTWCEAYKNKTGRKRIQKIISTDRRTRQT